MSKKIKAIEYLSYGELRLIEYDSIEDLLDNEDIEFIFYGDCHLNISEERRDCNFSLSERAIIKTWWNKVKNSD